MKKEYEKIRPWLKLMLIFLLIVVLILNYKLFLKIFGILAPFWTGLIIAYIINIPMMKFEHLYEKILPKKLKNLKRVFSILSVLVLAILIIFLLFSIVLPQLIETLSQVIRNSNSYVAGIENLVNDILTSMHWEAKLDLKQEITTLFNQIIRDINIILENFAPGIINNTIEITTSVLMGLVTFFIGFIISIYLLSSKESLLLQARSIVVAIFSEKYYNNIFKVCTVANQTFSKFISGQILDCIALGVLCFIGMNIFQFPYALLVSTLVTILAIIPYFGAFSAMFIGAILMLPNNPTQSLLFIIYFIVLQQLEGNFVYPRIVGNSVGLPGIWVLVSVILFSGLFGFKGLFFAVPFTAVIYSVLKEMVGDKLKDKNVAISLNDIQTQEELAVTENIDK